MERRLSRLVAWISKVLLDPDDWERVAEPALLDAEFEARSGHRRLLRSLLGVVVAVFVALIARKFQRIVHAPWLGMAALAVTSALGCAVLQRPELSGLIVRQWTYLAVALAIAAFVTSLRGHTLREAAASMGGVLAPALTLVVVGAFGVELEGARRWIVLGGLALTPSYLIWPFVLLSHAELTRRAQRNGAALILILAAVGLSLQRDPSAAYVLVFSAIVPHLFTAKDRRWHATSLALAALLVLVASAVLGPAALPELPHVEGAWSELARSSLDWFALAFIACAIAVTSPLRARLLTRGIEFDGGLSASTTLAMVGFAVRPLVDRSAPAMFLGYGGSSIIGGMAALAMAATLARDEGERPRTTSQAA